MTDKPTTRGRIALFLIFENLERLSFVSDALSLLVEHGFTVDIITPSARFPPKPVAGLVGVTRLGNPEAFLFVPSHPPAWIRKLRMGGHLYAWMEINIIRRLRRRTFQRFLGNRHSASPYICMIGNDPEGLVSAAPLAQMLGVPLVFWSMLLLFSDEIRNANKKRLKEMEIAASRIANFVIIQDQVRGEALRNENGLEPDNFVFIPNGRRGIARRVKSDYLYRRFNLSPQRKIILYTGMINRWTMCAELAQAASSWPEEYCMVMQSHMLREEYWVQDYLDEIVRIADPARVLVSFDPVPASEYQVMVDSADVGLVFYSPQSSKDTTQGKNVFFTGLSSGKMGGFLQSGLPLVVNEAVIGPKELVHSYHCGLCVKTPDQIIDALTTIFEKYDDYSSNATRCFNQEWELEAHFKKVIERIDQL